MVCAKDVGLFEKFLSKYNCGHYNHVANRTDNLGKKIFKGIFH